MEADRAILDYRDPDWVAERLGLDKNTVYKFLQDGTIPAVQLGRKWLISEARLVQWLRHEAETQTCARRDAARSAERTVKRLDSLTAGARVAVKHAHSEARRYGHEQLDQDHLLLGLAADSRGVAARVMSEIGIEPGDIRRSIESRASHASQPVPRRLGRTLEAKRAMRFAARVARRQSTDAGDSLVGTDHLLMGILLARRGRGFEFLRQHGVTRQRLRDALAKVKAQDPHSTNEGATNGKRSRQSASPRDRA
jgi:excisionase family DNA binding protein